MSGDTKHTGQSRRTEESGKGGPSEPAGRVAHGAQPATGGSLDGDRTRAEGVTAADATAVMTPARPDRIAFSRFRHRRPRPPKLYRIGEVVEYSGMSRQTIHNYTTMGILQESRWTPGGHRLYDESVFERLDAIIELKAASKSLQDIREHFEHQDAP